MLSVSETILGRVKFDGFDERDCRVPQLEADAYAMELAKLWIDGKTWGGNGRY